MRATLIPALAIVLMPVLAFADEEVMRRFTQSLKDLYIISITCEDTLTPSPSVYASAIVSYMSQYYDEPSSSYWVLPEVTPRSSSPRYCQVLLESRLLNYQAMRADFQEAYAEMPSPPHLQLVKETAKFRQIIRPNTPSVRSNSKFSESSDWGRGTEQR
jgi:hypothetical protein